MGIVSGGGGGGTVTPPVTLTGTDRLTIPLTVVGAHNQNTPIFTAKSFNGTAGIDVEGDGADDIDAVGLSAARSISLGSGGGIAFTATGGISLQGARVPFIGFNAAPADGDLAPGVFAFWLDQTVGATKLMVKAQDSGGTIRTAAIALA